MHTGDVQTNMWAATRCAGNCQRTPTKKSTRRAVIEGQRFGRRKVSATHEHVGARASPSYVREWGMQAHDACRNARRPARPLFDRRWSRRQRGDRPTATCDGPSWVPGRRRRYVCARAYESARTSLRQHNVGLRTIIIGLDGRTHPLRYCLVHANLSILYFCLFLLII